MDILLVVEGRHLHDSPADVHRLEDGERVQAARPPDIDADVPEPGDGLFGRELVGHRPSGLPADVPQGLLIAVRVHLHHQPVRLVGQVMAFLQPGGVQGFHLAEVGAEGVVGIDLEPQPLEHLKGIPVVVGHGCAVRVLDVPQAVHEDVQVPGGCDPGVQLPDGPCRSVAWVGVGRLATGLPLAVELPEGVPRHIHLASHLQDPGDLPHQGEGDALDRAQILSDVLAAVSVSPGGTPDQPALLVGQRHRKAVYLELADHPEVRPVQEARHPAVPRLQLL